MLIEKRPLKNLGWPSKAILVTLICGATQTVLSASGPNLQQSESQPGQEQTSAESERDEANGARSTKDTISAVSKEELRYAGKTFEDYRHLVARDLDPVTQSEALEAIAAFARHGYAEESLEIAKFAIERSLPEQSSLQVQCVEVMGAAGKPAVDSLVELLERPYSTKVRSKIVKCLIQAGIEKPGVREAIIRSVLDTPNSQVLRETIRLLDENSVHDRRLREFLSEVASNDDRFATYDREAAWLALSRVSKNDETFVDSLSKAISEGDPAAFKVLLRFADYRYRYDRSLRDSSAEKGSNPVLGMEIASKSLSMLVPSVESHANAVMLCNLLAENGALAKHVDEVEDVLKFVFSNSRYGGSWTQIGVVDDPYFPEQDGALTLQLAMLRNALKSGSAVEKELVERLTHDADRSIASFLSGTGRK